MEGSAKPAEIFIYAQKKFQTSRGYFGGMVPGLTNILLFKILGWKILKMVIANILEC